MQHTGTVLTLIPPHRHVCARAAARSCKPHPLQAAATSLRLPHALLCILGLSSKGASCLDPAAVPCILQHTGRPRLLCSRILYEAATFVSLSWLRNGVGDSRILTTYGLLAIEWGGMLINVWGNAQADGYSMLHVAAECIVPEPWHCEARCAIPITTINIPMRLTPDLSLQLLAGKRERPVRRGVIRWTAEPFFTLDCTLLESS